MGYGVGMKTKALFHKKGSSADSPDVQADYIFAFEDKVLREEAKRSLTFVEPDTNKYSDLAFEFTGNTTWSVEADASPQYKTIFTYSELPISGTPLLDHLESAVDRPSSAGSGYSYLIRGLSVLFLILFFPVLCWFFIKHLSRTERLIVFRLGRRLKTMGPGFVFLLPFCDRYHLIRLDEQTLEISPVSGGTSDEAIVEVCCSVLYRLIDPDYAYASVKESPSKLVHTQTQLCVLSSLKHLSWMHLKNGEAKQDLIANILGSLNCRCGAYGIQVSRVDVSDLRLIRPCPSPETAKRQKMTNLQKQLQALSSGLLGNPLRMSVAKHVSPTTDSPPAESGLMTNPGFDSTESTFENDHYAVHETATGEVQNLDLHLKSNCTMETTSLTRSGCLSVCKQAISRAQPLLNSSLACTALGRKTMQLIVTSGSVSEPVPVLAEAAKNERCTLMYMDSKRGLAALGCLPADETPDVTVYLSDSTLSSILKGCLNLSDALRDRTVLVTGNMGNFEKLRHLLYF
ncbi:hypothetical protein P879_06700 [Paragonimus westermani]|uniref:Band 7 domain-containing protein n=1 Tax=Paragonimus westermani TaxID=34504 RepID=A0A8T0DFD5_9TREM|nr:hypothetical protein P879_06700 [Paragonimus westermani]